MWHRSLTWDVVFDLVVGVQEIYGHRRVRSPSLQGRAA